MKIKFLIATADTDYSNYLSDVLRTKYAETFDVYVYSSAERLADALEKNHYDLGLFSPEMADEIGRPQLGLSLLLWDGMSDMGSRGETTRAVRKYQRISSLVGDILEQYAGVAQKLGGIRENQAKVTLAWSPAGGTGKTTVALAYATQCVAHGKKTLYLDLESFSSVGVYFPGNGKSISEVFEKLDGNPELLFQSIRKQDSGSGVYYFCPPNNYDDINVLTGEDMRGAVRAASQGMDEIVVDLSSICDRRYAELMELADRVLAVVDGSAHSQVKWEQFRTQHSLFEVIRNKTTLVGNMGAQPKGEDVSRTLSLPYVSSGNPVSVYKSLSAVDFGE